jgi:hypothetical protein
VYLFRTIRVARRLVIVEPDTPMKLPAVSHLAIMIAAVLLSSAAVAHAGRRGGTALEDPAHARANVPAARPAAPAARGGACDDDSPCLRPCAPESRGGAAAHPELDRTPGRAAQPASSDQRAEKRERGRTAPTGVEQSHRPPALRGKATVRSMPATPGMGLLLRFGTHAGLEISLNSDDVRLPVLSMRSGRAPPRAGPHPNLAPASPPRLSFLAIPSRAQRPSSPAGAPQYQPDTDDDPCTPSVQRLPASARHGAADCLACSIRLLPVHGARSGARPRGVPVACEVVLRT